MNWLNLIPLLAVAVAAVFLVRHLVAAWRSASDGHCSGCDSACGKPLPSGVRPAPSSTPLISLERRPVRRKEPS